MGANSITSVPEAGAGARISEHPRRCMSGYLNGVGREHLGLSGPFSHARLPCQPGGRDPHAQAAAPVYQAMVECSGCPDSAAAGQGMRNEAAIRREGRNVGMHPRRHGPGHEATVQMTPSVLHCPGLRHGGIQPGAERLLTVKEEMQRREAGGFRLSRRLPSCGVPIGGTCAMPPSMRMRDRAAAQMADLMAAMLRQAMQKAATTHGAAQARLGGAS